MRHRNRRLLVTLVVLVVLGWAGVSAVLLAGAGLDAREAKDELVAARDRFDARDLVRGEGLASLERARDGFASAASRSGSPVLAPARLLPVLGRQVRSLEALSGAGSQVLDVAIDAAAVVDDLTDGGLPAGGRVAAVDRLHDTVVNARDQLAGVSLGPDEALLSPLADARATLAEELADALDSTSRAEVVTAGLREVLRGSRYLVLAANNAEMQAGWGMPLSIGALEVVDGELGLAQMEPSGAIQLPADAVPIDGDFGAHWWWMRPSQDFRNLALTPDFDQAAPLAAAMWEELGRGPVDGVIALDPIALRAILAVTGPVAISDRMVGADDVVPLVLHDAYVEQEDDFGPDRDARRERQSEIAVAAVAAATAPGTDLVDLASSLVEAARTRHVLAWSSDPVQQAAWETAGVDGVLEDRSLLVAPVNRGANKLDWFMDVSATLTHTPTPAGTEVAVEVTMVNRTPDGEPRYVAGPHNDGPSGPGLEAGDWAGYLTAHVPGDALDTRIDDRPPIAVGPSGRTWLFASEIEVPKGETRTFTVHFRLPPGSELLRVEPSARVHPIEWRAMGESWRDDGGARPLSLSR